MKKFSDIFAKAAKNGFYIILFLCICAIGVAGYVMFRVPEPDSEILTSGFDEIENTMFGDERLFEIPIEEAISHEKVVIPEENKEEIPKPKSKPRANATAKKKETSEPEKVTYSAPVKGEVIVGFSGDELVKSKTLGDWRVHTGVDIKASEGTKVLAAADGTVKDVVEDEMMGHTVVIEHPDGKATVYSNLMKGITVKKGEKVSGGQVIGGVGSSALSECLEEPHLHFEMTVDGKKTDPMKCIGK